MVITVFSCYDGNLSGSVACMIDRSFSCFFLLLDLNFRMSACAQFEYTKVKYSLA